VLGVAAGHRVVLQLAEAAGEGDVLRPGDVLVAKEQHAMAQQQRADLGQQRFVLGRDAEVDARDLGADGAGQRLDAHRVVQGAGAHEGGRGGAGGGAHGLSPVFALRRAPVWTRRADPA
jgi:hypothetical protein